MKDKRGKESAVIYYKASVKIRPSFSFDLLAVSMYCEDDDVSTRVRCTNEADTYAG